VDCAFIDLTTLFILSPHVSFARRLTTISAIVTVIAGSGGTSCPVLTDEAFRNEPSLKRSDLQCDERRNRPVALGM
jgi:hypothetical protein